MNYELRITNIQTYFQRRQLLTTENPQYQKSLDQLFIFMKDADDARHDKSLQLFEKDESTKAHIIAKQNGVIAGIEEVTYLAHAFTNLKVEAKDDPSLLPKDGDYMRDGQTLLFLSGTEKELLMYERIFLNILSRMSGIATKTNQLVSAHNHSPLHIAATRKTPWMLLDKKSVAIGGGLTHRLSLADWPMIKDNHLAMLKTKEQLSSQQTISQAIKRLINESFFEIEVATKEQAEIAIQTFAKHKNDTAAMALMLDNFDLETATQTIEELKKHSVYKDIITEASGNITEKNLSEWATTGVDIISLGSLTHSAPNFDVSMKIV